MSRPPLDAAPWRNSWRGRPGSPAETLRAAGCAWAVAETCSLALLRFNSWVSAIDAVAAWRPRKHFTPRSRWQRCCSACTRITLMLLAIMLLAARSYVREWRASSARSNAIVVANVVLMVANPFVLFGGWYVAFKGMLVLAHAREDGSDSDSDTLSPASAPAEPSPRSDTDAEGAAAPAAHEEEEGAVVAGKARRRRRRRGMTDMLAARQRQRVFSVLPRAVPVMLAASFAVSIITFAIFVYDNVQDYRAGTLSLQELQREVVWDVTGMLCVTSPMIAVSEMLAAHALRLASRIHSIAELLPRWPSARAARELQKERRRLDRRMHSTSVSVLVFALVCSVVFSICYAAFLLANGAAVLVVVEVVDSIAYAMPALTAMYCVAEVTDGWMAATHALLDAESEHAAEPRRLMLGKQWCEAWQRGMLGAQVFGLLMTKGLVVKWLGSAGTLLGLLLRLNPTSCEPTSLQ